MRTHNVILAVSAHKETFRCSINSSPPDVGPWFCSVGSQRGRSAQLQIWPCWLQWIGHPTYQTKAPVLIYIFQQLTQLYEWPVFRPSPEGIYRDRLPPSVAAWWTCKPAKSSTRIWFSIINWKRLILGSVMIRRGLWFDEKLMNKLLS